MIMCSIGRQPSQSSQLSPSEPLNLQVRFRGLFRVVSKNKIPVDELLNAHSSGKQGKCLPFAIAPALLMQDFLL